MVMRQRQVERLDKEREVLAGEIPEGVDRADGLPGLVDKLYGVGWLLAHAIWAEMCHVRRLSRNVIRYAGIDITVFSSGDRRAMGSSAGHCTRRPWLPARAHRLTISTTARSKPGARVTAGSRCSRWHGRWPGAATTLCVSSARRPGRRRRDKKKVRRGYGKRRSEGFAASAFTRLAAWTSPGSALLRLSGHTPSRQTGFLAGNTPDQTSWAGASGLRAPR